MKVMWDGTNLQISQGDSIEILRGIKYNGSYNYDIRATTVRNITKGITFRSSIEGIMMSNPPYDITPAIKGYAKNIEFRENVYFTLEKWVQDIVSDHLKYDQLDENERVALTVAISFPHHTLRRILPGLFGWKASESTYYRYHREGVQKLKEKSILDENGNPTTLAFKIIPSDNLTEMVETLNKEVRKIYAERIKDVNKFLESEQKYAQLEKTHKLIDEENRRLKNEIGTLSELRDIKEKFDFTSSFKELKSFLSKSLQKHIYESIERFNNGDFDSSIVKIYLASEIITRSLFKRLYGNDAIKKVRKHNIDLKRCGMTIRLKKMSILAYNLLPLYFQLYFGIGIRWELIQN